MYVFMYVCMYACTYVCMYVSVYVCMCICMYVFMYVCVYVCMCVCMYVCMYVCPNAFQCQSNLSIWLNLLLITYTKIAGRHYILCICTAPYIKNSTFIKFLKNHSSYVESHMSTKGYSRIIWHVSWYIGYVTKPEEEKLEVSTSANGYIGPHLQNWLSPRCYLSQAT